MFGAVILACGVRSDYSRLTPVLIGRGDSFSIATPGSAECGPGLRALYSLSGVSMVTNVRHCAMIIMCLLSIPAGVR